MAGEGSTGQANLTVWSLRSDGSEAVEQLQLPVSLTALDSRPILKDSLSRLARSDPENHFFTLSLAVVSVRRGRRAAPG